MLETLQQISLVKTNVLIELMAGGVGASYFKCCRGDVGGMYFCMGQFLSESQRDAT